MIGSAPARTDTGYPGRSYEHAWQIIDGRKRRVRHEQLRTYMGPRRIPLLAYGALACPTKILSRLGDLADGLVCLPATVTGVARAWAYSEGEGIVPLYTLAADTEETEEMHVILVPDVALRILDLVEGAPRFYRPARLLAATVEVPGFGVWRQPTTYLGVPPLRQPAMDHHGNPFLVRDHVENPPAHESAADSVHQANLRIPTHQELRTDERAGASEDATFGSALGGGR